MGLSSDGIQVIEDNGILIEKDVPIPLADGHVVYCNVFRPNRVGVVPPIVVFTPYGKDSDVAVDFKRYWDVVLRDHPEVVREGSTGKYLTWEVPDPERWVPAGYAVIVVDARGTDVALSIGAIAGGAVGNVIDRLRYGWVVDFIHAHVGQWSWYVFNVADAAISVGVALMILDLLGLGSRHVSRAV